MGGSGGAVARLSNAALAEKARRADGECERSAIGRPGRDAPAAPGAGRGTERRGGCRGNAGHVVGARTAVPSYDRAGECDAASIFACPRGFRNLRRVAAGYGRRFAVKRKPRSRVPDTPRSASAAAQRRPRTRSRCASLRGQPRSSDPGDATREGRATMDPRKRRALILQETSDNASSVATPRTRVPGKASNVPPNLAPLESVLPEDMRLAHTSTTLELMQAHVSATDTQRGDTRLRRDVRRWRDEAGAVRDALLLREEAERSAKMAMVNRMGSISLGGIEDDGTSVTNSGVSSDGPSPSAPFLATSGRLLAPVQWSGVPTRRARRSPRRREAQAAPRWRASLPRRGGGEGEKPRTRARRSGKPST